MFGDHLPFVTPTDMDGGKWIRQTARSLSKAGEEAMQKIVLPQESVIVSCIGSDMGKAALTATACVTNQQINGIVVDKSRFDPDFLYYNLSQRKAEIRGMAGGSAQPILNKSHFSEITFEAPTLDLQREIVAPLKALDDKIALLRETNATLEAIAQAIFKSWFVDFDPVRAKAEGRDPVGVPPEVADLFPSEFEDSELGAIPKGWKSTRLSSLAELKGGKQLDRSEFLEEGLFPIFGGAGVMGRASVSNAEGFVIVVGRVGAYCGQFFWHQGKAWVNNNASQVMPLDASDAVWIYSWLDSVDIEPIKKGAAQPFVSNGDISNLKMIQPPRELRSAYRELVASIFEMITSNDSLLTGLSNLRDNLLPRLMSGKLRIPGIEEITA
jgi:type I restriction enzyme S subunit